jgi:hypothetical protein
MRAISMDEEERKAALCKIKQMEVAAKNGLLHTLQADMAELQNYLDRLVRREQLNKDKLFKSNKPNQ